MLWRGDVTGVSFDNGIVVRALINTKKNTYKMIVLNYKANLKNITHATLGTDFRSSGAFGPKRKFCIATLHES